MPLRRIRVCGQHRTIALLLFFGLLAVGSGLILSSGGVPETPSSTLIGKERIVAWEALPEMNGPMCEMVPASASATMMAALQQSARAATSDAAPPHPQAPAQARVA